VSRRRSFAEVAAGILTGGRANENIAVRMAQTPPQQYLRAGRRVMRAPPQGELRVRTVLRMDIGIDEWRNSIR
jgi:hypothetical protein